jgi:hypothetical protein
MDSTFKKPVNAGSDAYYKNQMESITKENKLLKYKLDVLERENKDLKKSIYDLSVRYDMLMHQIGKTAKPFNIDSIFENYIPVWFSLHSKECSVCSFLLQVRDINIVDTKADETTDQIPESGIITLSCFPFRLSNIKQIINYIILMHIIVPTRKVDERHFYYKYTLKV